MRSDPPRVLRAQVADCLGKGQSQTVVKNLAIYKTAQRNKQFMTSEVEKP